ncbi:MAG: archease [Patescibacteria group bacterium]|nr:archease [Patescibacteria group bacterium]
MPYRFLEHTADIRMMVVGHNLNQVFEDAFYGLMHYLRPKDENYSGQVRRLISVSSFDLTNLLIDFLNEILAFSQIHKEIYNKIKFIHFPDENDKNLFIEAEISGSEINCFYKDIKAITYHEANLIKNKDGQWLVIITFDI